MPVHVEAVDQGFPAVSACGVSEMDEPVFDWHTFINSLSGYDPEYPPCTECIEVAIATIKLLHL
jgi:hypothetical protein